MVSDELKSDILQRIQNATDKLNDRLSYDNCLTLYDLNELTPNPNPHNFYVKVVGNFSERGCASPIGVSVYNVFENVTLRVNGTEVPFPEYVAKEIFGKETGWNPANM